MPFSSELRCAQEACEQAGEIILRYYQPDADPRTTYKDDDSPLTRADLEAEAAILAHLRRCFPDDALLSEETIDDGLRLQQRRVWIVDPMDGTRDFVHRTGDFAVQIGLAVEGRPVLGCVYKPVGDLLYFAVAGQGALIRHGQADPRPLRCSTRGELQRFRIGVTRFAVNESLRRFMEACRLDRNIVQIGACIKMMAVAAGELEISLCLNPHEKEWDTCAAEVILVEAGATITDVDGQPFEYNKEDVHHHRGILISNGTRHSELVRMVRPFF